MINYIKGDLFGHTSKKAIVLAHACNPFGSWGGGIAAQFRKRYPDAYSEYALHCNKFGPELLGKSYVIPVDGPQKTYIACLFTSNFENSPAEIVEYTRESLKDLRSQLQNLKDVETDEEGKIVVSMPKINSGIFNVPWEKTESALKEASSLLFNIYTF